MRLRNLADVKVEVLTAGTFPTPWKHSLRTPIAIVNPITGQAEVFLYQDGTLRVLPGYMCDGPSGPTFDDATNRIPALVHDVAYQLLRSRLAPPTLTRKSADQVLRDMLIQYGMAPWRARLWYAGLRVGGWAAARPRSTLEKKYTLLES
jgi:hypothetical protein